MGMVGILYSSVLDPKTSWAQVRCCVHRLNIYPTPQLNSWLWDVVPRSGTEICLSHVSSQWSPPTDFLGFPSDGSV